MKTKSSGVVSYQFETKSQLDAWAKENITDSKVLGAVLTPVRVNGKDVNELQYIKDAKVS